jgi:hypothetical protein
MQIQVHVGFSVNLNGFPTRAVSGPTAAELAPTEGAWSRVRRIAGSRRKTRETTRPFRDATGLVSGTSVAQQRMSPATPTVVEERDMPPEPMRATEEVLRRVQGEFLEMPGLRLTEAQARRLWGLDAASCGALLGALVDAKFLFQTRDGAFMRIEHAEPVKATLRRKTAAA